MNLAEGGHLTHGSPVNMSGAYYNFAAYGVDPVTHRIDYDKLMEQACELKPKLIVAGASAYPRAIDFKKFREIADACGAYLMVDMAHIAGLVAGGCHMNPVPYADVVTTTTHKTLRGPRGGMILCREEYAKKIDKAIFPGTQGGPLMHIIAAKAVCLGEALKPEFKTYAEQTVKNAKALAEGLTKRGMKLVSGGTDNHLMLLDLSDGELTGKELPKIQHAFYEIYLPFDRGFLKISAVKEKCRTAHGMYQIRNNIRYKTGKRRKFAKFIEMNMQEHTILRYKKICSMFLPLQNFCKLHRAPQKSSVKKANNRFQKYQMSCYVN